MTLLGSSPHGSKRRAPRNGLPPPPRTDADINELWKLAESLDGRPLPGVRVDEEVFEAWTDQTFHAEWIDGEVILLSPSNIPHIKLNVWLCRMIEEIAESGDGGTTLFEPQVRLARVKQRRNPDVVYVAPAHEAIIKQTHIDGPPDLVMEIVSPDSQSRDWRAKYAAYEQGGVREYWVIDPQSRRVEAYTLSRAGKFNLIPENDGTIQSKVLRKINLQPQWLWKSPLPRIADVAKELGLRR
jgi:Uma2 family endonuclease